MGFVRVATSLNRYVTWTCTSGASHHFAVDGTERGSEEQDPSAVPGVVPGTDVHPDDEIFTLDVDGELFAVRPGGRGDTEYTWLSGPNTGDGFGTSGSPDPTLDEHRERVRDFLAMIDPGTGYIQED